VLVADDHPGSLDLIRSLLESEFDVIGTVSDGLELLDACDRLTPDVVVTDIAMPNLDGIGATARIRVRHADTPVVLLTIHATDAMAEAGRRAGASELVAKTSASELLPAAVWHAVSWGRPDTT
jgi:DNA-binding NarL/FixJ family response regulator